MMIEVRVPDEQEGTKAIVRAWLKQVGDAVAVNDPLVELETDKVTQEVSSPAAGVLSEILLGTDAEAVPGALLGRIAEGGSPAQAAAQEAKPSSTVEAAPDSAPGPQPSGSRQSNTLQGAPSPGNGEFRLSPSVKRAILQHGIDPACLTGTGRDGRITRDDVDQAMAAATTTQVGSPATAQDRKSVV